MSTDISPFLPDATQGQYQEAHPFGPHQGGFHPDLSIEIDPGVLENSPALALVDGLACWLVTPAVGDEGTLILFPSPMALHDLSSVVGHSEVVFIYHNIDPVSARERFRPIIEASPVADTMESLEDRVDRFFKSDFAVWVASGEELGLPSKVGSAQGWGRIGFEIAYLFPGTRDALVRRVLFWNQQGKEEAHKADIATRRLDPVSFFARVAENPGKLKILANADHILLTLPTRRILLEVRDEYDEPFLGGVGIEKNGEFMSNVEELSAANRGMVELANANSADGLLAAEYKVSRNLYVLTELPSGNSSSEVLSRLLSPPAHWAAQAIFMADLDGIENWFVTNRETLPRYTANNRVTPLIDGVDAFINFAGALRGLTSSGHYAYFANWVLMEDFPLDPMNVGSTVKLLVKNAALAGAKVRALLWQRPQSDHNKAAVDALNELRVASGLDVQAIHDGETHDCSISHTPVPSLPVGSHHQKIWVINGINGGFAFCGGIDVNRNRRDSPNHGAAAPYHDVHAKIEGPAVADIHRSFAERWNMHSEKIEAIHESDASFLNDVGSVFVQVACTYPLRRSTPYPFAMQGSFTPLRAFLRAIKKAKKFIYIEDQYLTPYPGTSADQSEDAVLFDDPLGILGALREALHYIDYIIMVIPNHSHMGIVGTLPGQNRYRRKQFIEGLRAIAPDKVHVFYLARTTTNKELGETAVEGDGPGTSGSPDFPDEIYCHSKVWIVDDVCAKIGSANCNRRSYTHDSEMDIVMVDGALDNGARALARNLRMSLWAEHLGLEWPESAVLRDHQEALKFWMPGMRHRGARIREYKHEELESQVPIPGTWNSIIDPDGSE